MSKEIASAMVAEKPGIRRKISRGALGRQLTLLIVGAGIATAQPEGGARRLLDQVVESAHSLGAWSAAGRVSIEVGSDDTKLSKNVKFLISMQRTPQRSRLEIIDGGLRFEAICDGGASWSHGETIRREPNNSYSQGALIGARLTCSSVFPFERLTDGLESATLVGIRTVEFEGRAVQCQEVRAKYRKISRWGVPGLPYGDVPFDSNPVRALCIDTQRRIVLRDSVQAGESVMRLSFEGLQDNPQLPPERFQFDRPAQIPSPSRTPSDADIRRVPCEVPAWPDGRKIRFRDPGGANQIGLFLTAPKLMQRVEAEYSDQARNAGMEGTVVLSVIIDSSGAVCDPVVIASLGSGLNEKAIESVSQWRFEPGRMHLPGSDSCPVNVIASIEVEFRLPRGNK